MARIRGVGRVVAIVAALVLAGVATFAITTYIRGIEQRAFEDAELVEVFVAQQEIPSGLSGEAAGEAGLIERGTIPNRNVPEGAVTSLEQISGLVSTDRVLPNEVLVIGRWADPDSTEAALIEIPEDFQALSVQVGIPPGVAGFIRPGSEVSLIATVERPLIAPGEELTADDFFDDDGLPFDVPTETATQYLLQNIQVLSTGQRVATEEGDDVAEGGGGILLTVALEPEDAERLVLAIETASLYFTLLPEDADPADTPGRTLQNLFDD